MARTKSTARPAAGKAPTKTATRKRTAAPTKGKKSVKVVAPKKAPVKKLAETKLTDEGVIHDVIHLAGAKDSNGKRMKYDMQVEKICEFTAASGRKTFQFRGYAVGDESIKLFRIAGANDRAKAADLGIETEICVKKTQKKTQKKVGEEDGRKAKTPAKAAPAKRRRAPAKKPEPEPVSESESESEDESEELEVNSEDEEVSSSE